MTIQTVEPTTGADIMPVAGSAGANLIREAAAVMADAHKLSVAICNTKMVPKHFQGQPDECAAAMLYGASLGFDPMQSIRQIYVVHGQAGLYGRSMVALVMSAGHKVWTVETSDDSVTVAAQRRGSQHTEQATWTIDRATKAGYVPTIDPDTGQYRKNQYGKVIGNEKYFSDPQGMLYAKAASEVCRKIAPDVLNGVYAVEELESDPSLVSVEQVRPSGLRSIMQSTQTSGADAGDAQAPGDVDAQTTGQPSAMRADSAPEPVLLNTSSKLAKAMYAGINELGIADNERIPFIVSVIDRPIESTKGMTEDEARLVLRHIDEVKEPVVDAEVVDS